MSLTFAAPFRAVLAAASLVFASGAVAQDADYDARLEIAERVYDDFLSAQLAEQAFQSLLPGIRRRISDAAAQEGRSLDEEAFERFAEALRDEIADDMRRLSPRWSGTAAGELTLEELQALERVHKDPVVRQVMSKLPLIMNSFGPAILATQNVTLRRMMADFPVQSMMR